MKPSEVLRLRDHLNRVVDDLHKKLEKKEQEMQDKWRMESEELKQRQEMKKKALKSHQEMDLRELRRMHREEEDQMIKGQLEQMEETRSDQEQELDEVKKRHKDEREQWEKEKSALVSKYMQTFQLSDPEKEEEKRRGRAADSDLLDRLNREIECPVCLVEMRGRVWQCVSGHLLCEGCHGRPEVVSCPVCRDAFTGRAITVEKMIKTISGEQS